MDISLHDLSDEEFKGINIDRWSRACQDPDTKLNKEGKLEVRDILAKMKEYDLEDLLLGRV